MSERHGISVSGAGDRDILSGESRAEMRVGMGVLTCYPPHISLVFLVKSYTKLHFSYMGAHTLTIFSNTFFIFIFL